MRIHDLRAEALVGGTRVAATVTWEDNDQPDDTVFFECPAPFGDDMAPSPAAFLLGGVMPAMDAGERRVEVEGAICPDLRNGLLTAMRIVQSWFPELTPPALEPTRGFAPSRPPEHARVAAFQSGGVDGLATLRRNRLDFPLDHPASIRDSIFLFGFNTYDFDAGAPVAERVEDFQRRLARLSGIARETQTELIPVSTNVRFLARDFPSWNQRGMGAGLAAVAHVFAGRVSRILIASAGYDGIGPPARGTHAMLDPHYGNAGLEVRHDIQWLTRLEKTALVAEWDSGLAILQCCQQHQIIREPINCGRCNKCFRTMIHLAALDKLRDTRIFPVTQVTPDMIRAAPMASGIDALYLEPAVDRLARLGRRDLADALRDRIEPHLRPPAPGRVGWRERIRRLDERWTGGRVRAARHAIFRR